MVKNPPANAGDAGDLGSIPGWEKISWWRTWQPTPVFLLGESYGQSSLVGHSPWGGEELEKTEQLTSSSLWTVARQAPLSMGFSRQEYWSGFPFPSPFFICGSYKIEGTMILYEKRKLQLLARHRFNYC